MLTQCFILLFKWNMKWLLWLYLIYEYFVICQLYYYSTYIFNLLLTVLMLLWTYDYECSQHHASFHVHVYLTWHGAIKIDWLIDFLLIDWLIFVDLNKLNK